MNEIRNISGNVSAQLPTQLTNSPQSKMYMTPQQHSCCGQQTSPFLGLDSVIGSIFAGMNEMFKSMISFVTMGKLGGSAATTGTTGATSTTGTKEEGGSFLSNLWEGGKDLLSTIGGWFGLGSGDSSESGGGFLSSLISKGSSIFKAGKGVFNAVKSIF